MEQLHADIDLARDVRRREVDRLQKLDDPLSHGESRVLEKRRERDQTRGRTRRDERKTHVHPFTDPRVVVVDESGLLSEISTEKFDRSVSNGWRAVVESILDGSANVGL